MVSSGLAAASCLEPAYTKSRTRSDERIHRDAASLRFPQISSLRYV